jgi:hypothetical protein
MGTLVKKSAACCSGRYRRTTTASETFYFEHTYGRGAGLQDLSSCLHICNRYIVTPLIPRDQVERLDIMEQV